MVYDREIYQVQKTIVGAGNSAVATFKGAGEKNPITGLPTGVEGISMTLNFVATDYTREEISNPDLANGLTKILVTPLKVTGEIDINFVRVIEDKTTKVILPDGKEFGIRYSQITRAYGVTPIMARVFLGA